MKRIVIAITLVFAFVVTEFGGLNETLAAPPKKADSKRNDGKKKKAPPQKSSSNVKKPAPTPITKVDSSAATGETGSVSDDAKNSAEKTPEGKSSLAKAVGGSGDSKAPVFITSDSLKLDARERVFTYYDNVKIVKEDTTITADKVTGRYDAQNQIERAVCERNVIIVRGDTIRATSNRADYDVKKGVIVMTESPELNDRGNVLNADRVTIYVNEDRSEADGHVRVKVLKTDQQASLVSGKSDSKSSSEQSTSTKPNASAGAK